MIQNSHDSYKQIEAKFKKQCEQLKNTIEAEVSIAEQAEQLIQRIENEYNKIIEANVLKINDGLSLYRSTLIAKAKHQGASDLKIGANLVSLDEYLVINIELSNNKLTA